MERILGASGMPFFSLLTFIGSLFVIFVPAMVHLPLAMFPARLLGMLIKQIS